MQRLPTQPTVADAAGRDRPRTYDAFLSYSHAADGLLAPRLQSALQRVRQTLTRGFTEIECTTYDIDPCPSLEEMGGL